MTGWESVLELDHEFSVRNGAEKRLQKAIRQGADLRIYTEFYHHEHIEPGSDNRELMQEVSDFRITYLVDDSWAAGIMNLRMPIHPPVGFGPRPSMSFFLYNQNGRQAIARPHLDGESANGVPGESPLDDHDDMPKYHQHDGWDADTNAPSSNFTYEFEMFKFLVRDEWREVYAHDGHGVAISGSLTLLTDAFLSGCEIKVGIQGLCADMGEAPDHEVFVHTGPGYFSTQRKIFCAGSQPVVRVKPAIPLQYASGNWDFGWLMVRSDGHVARWLCDPYSLEFTKSDAECPIRWFAR